MRLKSFLLPFVLALLIASCKSTSPINTSKNEANKSKFSKNEKRKTAQLIDELISTAKENIGVKYKYAGTSKAGYDCSGLIYSVYKSQDIVLPRNSYEQSKVGQAINLKKDQAQKGDLVFFTTNSSRQINHVGLVTEVTDQGISFIHSSTSKGVIISSTKEPYYKRTLIQVNRIF
ncbi:C40 family peptidase [Flavobacterium sp. F-328]|jgi:cell wall-associated NlpC family hydrolase|uniref:C40 family peptidase n=1 Tax=Flavobacterium erciyesense TaxID=2825842 RepID=A0ABS5D5S2_9FLAO|nr:C40 family peptidase [Flavobacterium erciyesense]MBQ0909367.1 C40 family peptidase [Flavobacterium erciyesense]